MPNVDTICMNVFLEELSKEIKEDAIIIMDGAGWHKSKDLIIPKNLQIVILPPYCPELNPVERFWKFIKDNTIKNKVFESLQELEDEICEFIKNLTSDTIMSVCGE
jgi:transposase